MSQNHRTLQHVRYLNEMHLVGISLLLEVGLEVVHCCEVVFGSDEIVQIAHVCLFAMRGIGPAEPPHSGSVA